MKKFVLTLGLAVILLGWGWPGYLSGTAPAFGQPYPPPPPPPGYCDPYYYNCTYNNYYSAPYANPLDQFSSSAVPKEDRWGDNRAARAPKYGSMEATTPDMKAGTSGIKAGVV